MGPDTASLSRYHGYGLFLLAVLIVSGLWTQLDRTPVVSAVLFCFLLLLSRLGQNDPTPFLAGALRYPQAGRGQGLVIGGIILAPLIVFLAATWRQEFPFVGDHDFHLVAQMESWGFWSPRLIGVALLLGAGLLAYRHGLLAYGIPLGFAALLLWSYRAELPWQYARYPGSDYFFALPVSALGRLAAWDSPLNVGRVYHVLAVALWLFALRPLALCRWPGLELLPFGIFYFWQKDVVYWFSSVYLEPTAVLLILLAAEYLLDSRDPRSQYACLLVGLAAMFKEQAVLLLPFFWVASRPWRLDRAGRYQALLVGAVSMVPFLYYYIVRNQVRVWRTAELAGAGDVFSVVRVEEFLRRMWFQFQAPGLVALAVALAALTFECLRRDGQSFKLALLAAAAMFHVAFFYGDKLSVGWTGYSRFHLFSLALLGLGLVTLARRLLDARNYRQYAALVVAIAGLNGMVELQDLHAAVARPDPYRNFTEHVDAPFFQSIRSVVERARREGRMNGIDTLVLADRIGTYTTGVWGMAYADLARQYRLEVASTPDPVFRPRCSCRGPAEALVVPFKVFAGLLAGEVQARASEGEAGRRCLAQLRASCKVVVEDRSDGVLLAAVGIGLR